ncbi:centrosome-associated zinc finger protein CP190 isoform X2 [Folsomia candida]|uniref:centrosome-associated zinc finger protein CP190 isoform X2 n=1 Tax=Folsomia candida TaxID=158441 RepID=UPI000B8EFDCF|nr:centrosome-associated zinc finger protein CP190 isoform X2 [Folsomia candida]
MSELTKVQTPIIPGAQIIKVEMQDPDNPLHQLHPSEDVPEPEGLSVEVEMTTHDQTEDDDDGEEVEEEDDPPPDDDEEEDETPAAPITATPNLTTTTIAPAPFAGGRKQQSPPTQQQQQHHQVQQKFQDVRVDNWGNYCLQRLQVMFERGDFCDLTLQFHTNQLLKVHRVVVNLCTEYFANLERLFGLTDGVLVLPKDVEYQAMVTIVTFFYTGKLEIRGNQFNEVYRTVKLMNITILIKLLEAHARKPTVQAKKEQSRPIIFKQAVEIGRPLAKAQVSPAGGGIQMTGTPVRIGGTTTLSIAGAGGTKTLQVTTPGAKLPPGIKTKTVLARVQPQGMRLNQQGGLSRVMHSKKLPIWKERKYPGDNMMVADKWHGKDEPARPTRFEWGDPDDDPLSLAPASVISHTLMEKQKSANSTRKVEDIFDAVKTQTLGKRSAESLKMQDNRPLKTSRIMIPSSEVIISSQNVNDDVNLTDDTVEEEVCTTEVSMASSLVAKNHTPTLKPAIKTLPTLTRLTPMVGKNDPNLGALGKSSETPSFSGSRTHSKTVRFAPEVEKENSKTTNTHTAELSIEEDIASSHSKIIAEVLKKYPDLIKEKQNIRLKIVQKGAESSSSKDKSKVSYIVLKSTSSPEALGAVLLKKPNHTTTNKAFWDNSLEKDKKPSGAENTTGPWLCYAENCKMKQVCGGDDDETPMVFESYYAYRRHLVDVHGERIDARICEYCGQKASKRNLLLYHLYTKHGVNPPKNMNFPNCDRCDYIALSESLLSKHKLTHDATKEFSCQICSASFKSSGALQGHMSANLHRNKDTKVYECPYCRKPFVRNINLKGHIRSLHRDIARIEEMDDPRLPHDETLVNRVNMSFNTANRKRQFPSILGSRPVPLEILPGDGQQQVSLVTADGHTIEILHGGLDPSMSVPMALVPSSEAEAMSNVASSIAASLGLEQGVHGTTEFITGDGSQAVYIMDNSQPAVEVDMSAMGLGDGTMIYDGDDPNSQGPFIVQDIHGKIFRKMTGIDETGKPVIFFQLSEDHGQMTNSILEDGIQMATENSSVFVSSDVNVPVTSDSGSGEPDDGVYDLVSNQDQESQVIISHPDMTNSDHEGEELQNLMRITIIIISL